MKRFRTLFAGVCALVGFTTASSAQTIPNLGATGPMSLLTSPEAIREQAPFLAAAMSEFISDSRNFSARAEIQLPGRSASDTFPARLAMSEGRMRWLINLSEAGAGVPEEWANIAKQLKMDAAAVYMKPDTNIAVAFPRLKKYFTTPLPKDKKTQEAAQDKIGKLQKTPVGREVIDGHPCIKYRLTTPAVEGDGPTKKPQDVALTWEATDLNNMPIKLLVRTDGKVFGMLFRDIRPLRPTDKMFEPPAEYTKSTATEIMQSATMDNLANLTENLSQLAAP